MLFTHTVSAANKNPLEEREKKMPTIREFQAVHISGGEFKIVDITDTTEDNVIVDKITNVEALGYVLRALNLYEIELLKRRLIG